jgi:hypothetical protein
MCYYCLIISTNEQNKIDISFALASIFIVTSMERINLETALQRTEQERTP